MLDTLGTSGAASAVVEVKDDGDDEDDEDDDEDDDSSSEDPAVEMMPDENEVAQKLLKAKKDEEDAKLRVEREHQFLNFARSYDWPEVAKVLWWDNSMVNACPLGRWSALHQAALAGEKSVCEWLLVMRADATLANGHGQTPLDVAHARPIMDMLLLASEGKWRPSTTPTAPVLVGGHLPHSKGGSPDDYFWDTNKYQYHQTFRGAATAAHAAAAQQSAGQQAAAAQPMAAPTPWGPSPVTAVPVTMPAPAATGQPASVAGPPGPQQLPYAGQPVTLAPTASMPPAPPVKEPPVKEPPVKDPPMSKGAGKGKGKPQHSTGHYGGSSSSSGGGGWNGGWSADPWQDNDPWKSQ